MEEYIEELQQRLVGQQARERELEKRIREANDQKMNHMREVDASAQRLRELKNKIHGTPYSQSELHSNIALALQICFVLMQIASWRASVLQSTHFIANG